MNKALKWSVQLGFSCMRGVVELGVFRFDIRPALHKEFTNVEMPPLTTNVKSCVVAEKYGITKAFQIERGAGMECAIGKASVIERHTCRLFEFCERSPAQQ